MVNHPNRSKNLRFIASFNMLDAAFEDQLATEAARIIRGIAVAIEGGADEGACRGMNGNTVGSWNVRGGRT